MSLAAGDAKGMSSTTELIAAGVRPPIAGECYQHNITAAVIVRAIPAAWQGQGVSWVCSGGGATVAFGTSAGALASVAVAALATGTPPVNTVNPNAAMPYADGAQGYAEIRSNLLLTHYAVIGAAGTITFARSSFAANDS